MGKSKKDKRNRKDDELDDEDDVVSQPVVADDVPEQLKPASKKTKGKKKRQDDWEDDVAAEIAALSLENNQQDEEVEEVQPARKEKKKKKKKGGDVSDEDDAEEDVARANQANKKSGKKIGGMSAFQMLDMLGSGSDVSDSDEDQSKNEQNTVKKVKKSPAVEANDHDFDNEKNDVEQSTGGQAKTQPKKGKKEKKKQNKQEEEDIDAILASLEQPGDKGQSKKGKKGKKGKVEEIVADDGQDGEKISEVDGTKEKKDIKEIIDLSEIKEAAVVTEIGEDEFEDRRKKKSKKGKTVASEKTGPEAGEKVEDKKDDDVEGEGDDEDGDEDGQIKTKAQKKKEKRERQKKQKLEEKLKGKSKKTGEEKDTEKSKEPEVTPETATQEMPVKEEVDKGSGAEDEDESKSSKKKKERKKKKDKKEEEEKKKKPARGQIKAMQEALQKVKEEEERLKREEEEKERKAEEARRLKEEKLRLEKERKEKLKQKKKDREQRLKAEGKWLTEKQKQDRQRAMQMLAQMKAQGLEIPVKENTDEPKKKRVVYEHKKKRKPGQKEDSPSESVTPADTPAETPVDEPEKMEVTLEKEVTEEKEVEEPVQESWEEEVKDDWAASDEETSKPGEEDEDEEVAEDEDEEEVEEEDSEDEDEEKESSEEDSESESEEETESDSEEESDEDDGRTAAEKIRDRALARIQKRQMDNENNRTTDVLRAPVVCVLGHVDTGKTKILDKLRRTHVQDGEAGGITQQIGATNVPVEAVKEQTKMCKDFAKSEFKLPGLLIIDTPGHESFSNLRSRGSSLCDIAVLVVDIMHGLEPQTIESINLLKSRKTPFVVALNKIDRLYQWKTNPHTDVYNTLKKQNKVTRDEFEDRTKNIIVEFAQQSLNVTLFYENKNPREWISMVPTSAHSGDGMGNLMALLCELTQSMLAKRLAFSNELQATVMEVKALPGLGTTIDVILVNGVLHESDTIVVAGQEGPIVTQIRGLLVPPPMKELRVKNQYEKVKELRAAQGVKIIAKDLEKALAGLPLYVANYPDEVDILKEETADHLKKILNAIKLSERGVFVQASTLGSLEALLEFLRTSKIPYANINIGPVHKRDVMRASVMVEHDIQYAVILAFDVKVERDAQELADSVGVRIFTADIIYHLFDAFMAYRDEFKKRKKDEFKHIAVFPCKLRILPQYIFNSRDPIVVGVSVEAGVIRDGTPICVPSKEDLLIGRVSSIENNHKVVEEARRGAEVCIKIESTAGEAPKMYGRHFDHNDLLVSKITRESIDALKDYFRDDMQKTDWQLIVELKKMFMIH